MFVPAAMAAVGALASAGTATAAGMSALSLTGTMLSTAAGIGSSIYQGISGQQAGQYQASVARVNQRTAQQMAERERMAGQTAVYDQDLKNKAVGGNTRAQLGASGFDVNSGSLLDVQAGQAEMGRVDSLRQQQDNELRAWRYDVQASQFGQEARLARHRGRMAMIQGGIGAATSLIGGATSFADRWTTAGRLGYSAQW